jgi:hypothetical protein
MSENNKENNNVNDIIVDNSNKYIVKTNLLFPKHIIFYRAGKEVGSLDVVVDFEKLPEDLHVYASVYLSNRPVIIHVPIPLHIEKSLEVVEPIKKPWWKIWG